MTLRKIFIAVIFLIGIFAINSCKTTKKRDEVSKLGKRYQNMTSYYNGYFNANEIYQNSIANLEKQHIDDYNKILSLYPARDVSSAKSVTSDLDKVIEKLGRVINLHRASDWVDDSYLLMGKAEYAKQDFEKAQKVFEYFIDEMNPAYKKRNYKTTKESKKSKTKKKKTKKRKARKSKKKKHRKKRVAKKKDEKKEDLKKEVVKSKEEEITPTTFHSKGTKKDWNTYNEGLLWMAKTYIEREKWASAYYLLTRLRGEAKNKTLKRDYPVVKAYYYLKQKNYTEAIKPLQNAITYAKKKKDKARLTFILGQIYERLDNKKDAYNMFVKVGKLHPNYDLEFNAKLKLLKNYNGASEEYALKQIKKLLKEEKYLEYQDKIYFTMAEINFNQNNMPEGIINLNKSIAKNVNNPTLKAESYYKLADIKFNKQDYISSKYYYDSTLTVMEKTDERYLKVKKFSENLKDIARNLETIKLQDSLIRISNMSSEEQKELALELKKKELKAKKAEKEKSEAKSVSMRSEILQAGPGGMIPSRRGGKKSSFVFYNPDAVEIGKREFQKIWGISNLEDNWRRSNRTDGEFNNGTSDEEIEEVEITDSEIKAILKGVPHTPEQLDAANNKIIAAMLNLGILYRDKLNNYEKSVEILEKLFNKYSDFDDKCKAMYYLNLSYRNINKYAKADNIISRMSNSFPECTYTKLLTDPEFGNAKKNKINAKEQYYKDIFQLYQNGDYEDSFAKIENADDEFKKDEKYKIKIDYLKAKLTGKLKGKDAYILALEDFIKQYPKSKEAIHAKEALRFIKGEKDTFSKLIYEEDLADFSYQPNKLHYILIVIHDIDDKVLKEIKTSISNYNKKYHKLERLKMSNIYFDTKGGDQVILLRKFDKAKSAMKYFNEIAEAKEEFIKSSYDFEIYAVSQKNYREVIKQRSIDKYKVFFNKKYIENK